MDALHCTAILATRFLNYLGFSYDIQPTEFNLESVEKRTRLLTSKNRRIRRRFSAFTPADHRGFSQKNAEPGIIETPDSTRNPRTRRSGYLVIIAPKSIVLGPFVFLHARACTVSYRTSSTVVVPSPNSEQ